MESIKKYEQEARAILAQMTLEEKAGLMSGSNFWETKDVARLGVPKTMVTDGPHGLRKQTGGNDHLGINQSVPATCFPTASATACSFDRDLLGRVGKALGEECLQEEVGVLLGPGVNMKRSPLCGRNFEYFSEDPYLAGQMAAAWINGVQSQGVGTSLKHFAGNNQEHKRMVINSVIDERALREIYLPGFETAVKEAQPWTVMCCYNQLNGAFGSENHRLLTEILKDEWGFDGVVVTDWGAVADRVTGMEAGLDLEMPYRGPENDRAIAEAVKNGQLSEAILDDSALRMLCMLLAAKDAKRPGFRYAPAAHHQLAREAAASSMVLLKNEENILPLNRGQKIALIGEFARTPRYQGAGSSKINPTKLENLLDVFQNQNLSFTFQPGYVLTDDAPDAAMIAAAAESTKGADAAVVCIGLPDSYESEGFDRTHMHLPQSHVELLREVAKVNPNTVVLLFCGSAVEMPWIDDAKALLMLYLGGEAGALAAADVLFGDVNPSGKLAETFPMKLEDNPSYAYFPGGDRTVEYRESIYTGYRYYDKVDAPVRFPFGYGLSYTTFAYSDLKTELLENQVRVSLNVTNTGNRAGAESVQFYVSHASLFRPLRELKGFAKVFLNPGETKEVSVTLDSRAFAHYVVEEKDWQVDAGEYTIAAAASSRDIRLEQTIRLNGEAAVPEAAPASYARPSFPFRATEEDFAQLYRAPLPAQSRQPGDLITISSPLGETAETPTGRALLATLRSRVEELQGSSVTGSAMFVLDRLENEIPMRSVSILVPGLIAPEELRDLVAKMNRELAEHYLK